MSNSSNSLDHLSAEEKRELLAELLKKKQKLNLTFHQSTIALISTLNISNSKNSRPNYKRITFAIPISQYMKGLLGTPPVLMVRS